MGGAETLLVAFVVAVITAMLWTLMRGIVLVSRTEADWSYHLVKA